MGATRSEAYSRRQEERSRTSRQHILDSAVRCLIEHGYAGASTLRIQELAGVSRGRLLHHFPSREELLVAAVQHLATNRVAELRRTVGAVITAGPRDPRRIAEAVEQMWATFHQPYFWAAIELWVASRHSEPLREVLRVGEDRLSEAIWETLDALFGPELAASPRYRQTAEILVSSMRGVALSYAFAPRDPAHDPHLRYWCSMAELMLSAEPRPHTG